MAAEIQENRFIVDFDDITIIKNEQDKKSNSERKTEKQS